MWHMMILHAARGTAGSGGLGWWSVRGCAGDDVSRAAPADQPPSRRTRASWTTRLTRTRSARGMSLRSWAACGRRAAGAVAVFSASHASTRRKSRRRGAGEPGLRAARTRQRATHHFKRLLAAECRDESNGGTLAAPLGVKLWLSVPEWQSHVGAVVSHNSRTAQSFYLFSSPTRAVTSWLYNPSDAPAIGRTYATFFGPAPSTAWRRGAPPLFTAADPVDARTRKWTRASLA